jgi:hypothetical protein
MSGAIGLKVPAGGMRLCPAARFQLSRGQPLHERLAQSRIAVHSGNPKITLVKHIDSVIIDDLERQRR